MRALGSEFDEFVAASSSGLLRTAYLLTGDRGHAEDLLQTVLLRTARRWPAARGNPTAYARRVLVNLAKDRWRNRGRRPGETALGDLDRVATAEAEERTEERIVLRDALLRTAAELPARQRAVLVLRYFDQLSIDETAEVLGCSPGTVKSQTHHALARLRERLAEGAVTDSEDIQC